MKKKIPVCENHLTSLYNAMNSGDVEKVEELEHELTPEEACVACTYTLNTKGTAEEALALYLKTKGYEVDSASQTSAVADVRFWTLRIFFFSAIFALLFVGEKFTQLLMFHMKKIELGVTPIEFVVLLALAIAVFTKVDDVFE